MKKLAIIIPVFNEEKNIQKLLADWTKEISRYYKKNFKFIIINDGSTDKTHQILRRIKHKSIDYINQKNVGHGNTCFKGYKLAIKKKYDIILQIDSDNQCDPKYFKHFINKIDLPEKWLDLGCHLGHFSLQLNSLRRSAGKKLGKGLLIDADSRIIDSIDKTIEINSLETYFKFKSGVLGSNKNTYFYEDDFMSSSNIESIRNHAKKRKVELITENEIIKILTPPYDLVKVDIEGGEYEFLENYQMILRQTKYLFLEWHSWHSGGGGLDQIKECLEKLNFSIIDETRTQKTIDNRGKTGLIFAKFTSE